MEACLTPDHSEGPRVLSRWPPASLLLRTGPQFWRDDQRIPTECKVGMDRPLGGHLVRSHLQERSQFFKFFPVIHLVVFLLGVKDARCKHVNYTTILIIFNFLGGLKNVEIGFARPLRSRV